MTNENKKLKDDMAQVKSERLISEEERRKDKEQIGGISRELKILKKKGNSADYTRINEEQIEPLKRELKQNQETLNELHRRIKEIPEIKVVTEVSCGWEERLKRLEDLKIQRNDSPYRNTNEKIKVKENILILGDSNTKKILTDRFKRYSLGGTKKVFCPLFEQVIKLCDNIEIERQPEKILIHCGTTL